MRKIFTLIICCSSFLFTSMVCSEMDTIDIVIINNCDETIYYSQHLFDTQDTILTVRYIFHERPNEIMNGHMSGLPPKEIKIGKYPMYDDNKQTWQMIVFKQSTLDKYTKEELVEKNIYDTIFVFTYSQLDYIKSQINIW